MKRNRDMLTMIIDEYKINSNYFEVFFNANSRRVVLKYHKYKDGNNLKLAKNEITKHSQFEKKTIMNIEEIGRASCRERV